MDIIYKILIQLYLYVQIFKIFIHTLYCSETAYRFEICDARADDEYISRRFSAIVVVSNANKTILRYWTWIYCWIWYKNYITVNGQKYDDSIEFDL